METHDAARGRADSFSPSESQPLPTGSGASVRSPVDHLELKREWVQEAEERQVEETLNLYVRAARQRMRSAAEAALDSAVSEEELEARSQELKLQQKCQDIAAQIMVDELEEDLEDGEE